MSRSSFSPTPRTTLRRAPERGCFERETIHAILDEALVCHVGFVAEGQPYVIPTIHARVDDRLYLHGSTASRLLRALAGGARICITATLVDGLVLARSAFHHSMNYRSVVLLGQAREVTDAAEKLRALEALVEHVLPGRSCEVRGPNEKEFARTRVVCVPIEEVSAKVRTGPPRDDEEDYALAVWAGELPLRQVADPPRDDGRLAPGVEPPACLFGWSRGAHGQSGDGDR